MGYVHCALTPRALKGTAQGFFGGKVGQGDALG